MSRCMWCRFSGQVHTYAKVKKNQCVCSLRMGGERQPGLNELSETKSARAERILGLTQTIRYAAPSTPHGQPPFLGTYGSQSTWVRHMWITVDVDH